MISVAFRLFLFEVVKAPNRCRTGQKVGRITADFPSHVAVFDASGSWHRNASIRASFG
jgi:hypothetical protein